WRRCRNPRSIWSRTLSRCSTITTATSTTFRPSIGPRLPRRKSSDCFSRMNVQVVVQTDDGQERSEIFQPKGPISIGRHPNCVLRLESDLVSRQHAVVEVRPQSIVVEDVSTNGTLAGDRLLRRESVEIPFGTPIVVGNFTIYLLSLDAQQQPQQQMMQRPPPQMNPQMNPGMSGAMPMQSYGPPPMPVGSS